MEKLTLLIDDMSCASCALGLEKGLQETEGIKSAMVNFAVAKAYVEFDPEKLTIDQILNRVSDAGFKGTPEQGLTSIADEVFVIEGMHCASCAIGLEGTFKNATGVIEATVNLATEKAHIKYDKGKISHMDLVELVKSAGYSVVETGGTRKELKSSGP